MNGSEARRNGSGRTRVRLWRWRSNPLRRRDDVVEAWIVLVMWLVVVVGGALVGLVTSHAADEMFARRRAERHPVRAVLVTDAPYDGTARGGTSVRTLTAVRWTADDGTARTGRTLVDSGLLAGSRVTVWLDRHGALTTEPTPVGVATAESALFGGAAALALSGDALATASLARRHLDRRRLAQWGKEWEAIGPRWDQKTG
ncbi:hypothetical protein ACFOOM_24855 [Streptomyces echinoruber]|uniref:Rv1733c family protein n=1 Tax=Streptomyces echinoruber TaxID=68898 RepID=UPI003615022D